MASEEKKQQSAGTTSSDPKPPPPEALVGVFCLLGAVVSFVFGRSMMELELLPTDGNKVITELCPSVIVICIFFTSYNLYDAFAAGVAKLHAGLSSTPYNEWPNQVPESVYIADRAQMNQVEQMVPFVMSTILFSIFVNGMLGGILACLWVILRRLYARLYRSSNGIPILKKQLGTYTVPCYFIINTMAMATAVHAIRYLMYKGNTTTA